MKTHVARTAALVEGSLKKACCALVEVQTTKHFVVPILQLGEQKCLDGFGAYFARISMMIVATLTSWSSSLRKPAVVSPIFWI
jgi:hypothetical protein